MKYLGLNKGVFEKVIEIEKELANSWKNVSDLSIYTGISGTPIFYYLLFNLTKEKSFEVKMYDSLEIIFSRMESQNQIVTFSGGMAGTAYMINFLIKESVLDLEDVNDSLMSIDEVLIEKALRGTNEIKSIDLLHGSLGIGYYLLSRTHYNETLSTRLFFLTEKIADIVDDYCSKSYKMKNQVNVDLADPSVHTINCGFAHGLVSYISFFIDILEQIGHNIRIKETLIKCIKTLLEFRSPNDNSLSVFPGIAVNKHTANYNIHLGWCYGDQIVSLVLLKAGVFLQNNSLVNLAKTIAYRTLNRTSIEKSVIFHGYDSGFCHGTAGVSYLFKKWGAILKDDRFKDAANIFVRETLTRGCRINGIAGYQKALEGNEYDTSYGMLDGAIGIGIVLMDSLLEEGADWDNFFALNISPYESNLISN